MKYYINRGGQQYGPYSLADLQKYFNEGAIVAADLARGEGAENWVPVTQVLGVAGTAANPAQPSWQPAVAQPVGGPAMPLPPSMHWGLVLLLSMITCGVFALVWMFVQAGWAKKIDPANRSTFWFGLGIGLGIAGYAGYAVIFATGVATSGDPSAAAGMAALAMVVLVPCIIAAQACVYGGIMELRSSLEIHYNTVEAIKLRLSGPLSWLFNVLYFQHHLTRIYRWKTTGYLSQQNIKA